MILGKDGENMKITFDDDGFESLTIIDNRKPKEGEQCDVKHCWECRYFHRHYTPTADGTAFTLLNKGHCYPPRDHTHIKIHDTPEKACSWFKQTEV